jgi:serine/threonine-protein kinase
VAPLSVSGTVPPSRSSKASEAELAAFKRKAAGGKGPYIAVALTALVAAGWVGRDKLSALAGVSAPKEEAVAVLKATSNQQGIKLVVDGKDIGTLPQELKGLTPGEHSVVFEGGDRYAPQKTTVVVGPNETKTLDPVSLKVTKGAATFDVKTAGAALALVASDERRALTDYSRPIDVDTSKSWTLEATKAGYKTLKLPITFEDSASKTFPVTLDSDKGGGVDISSLPQDNANDTAQPAGKAAAKGGGKVAVAKNDAPAPEAPKAAAPSGNCTLNFNSIPASRVVLDGRPLGTTPKMSVSASAGPHTVLFVGDSGKKSMSASCKAGETKTVATRLSQ